MQDLTASSLPRLQPKKQQEVKKYLQKETVVNEDDVPLDDPVAEKLRQQRLVEQADFVAAKELFGGSGDTGGINLDTFLPKSVKEFEDYANAISNKYILGHKDSKNYKMLVKALTKKACEPLSAADSKEVESYVGVVRVEKTKAEQAAKAKLAPNKKSLQGSGKGGLSVGLDDYQYADAGDGDDDFM
jgi:translation initiation factor 3 subunit J